MTAADVATISSIHRKHNSAKIPKAKKIVTPTSSEDENISLNLADFDDYPDNFHSSLYDRSNNTEEGECF